MPSQPVILLLSRGELYPPYRRGEVVNVRDEEMNCVERIRSAGNTSWHETNLPRVKPVSVCFEQWSFQSVSHQQSMFDLLPCLTKPKFRWAILVDDISLHNL